MRKYSLRMTTKNSLIQRKTTRTNIYAVNPNHIRIGIKFNPLIILTMNNTSKEV